MPDLGEKVEEPSFIVEDDHDLRDDHAVPKFSTITEFDSPLEEKITRKVNMEGKCIQNVSSQDLNDSDTSEAPLEVEFVNVMENDKPAKITSPLDSCFDFDAAYDRFVLWSCNLYAMHAGSGSRKKRQAVIGLNKIGVEIKKAKRSNNNNGSSLKRRVLA
ncbi:uncharacterized protein LOC130134716 [Syzygium oleosum]|uniref:uncharacterized protein LOC130134716 n=1 Tax=Syzygium oleosum TaxID=219896 RepID=UPI0024B8B6AC|nr:uncharacterized protein LOC130134716 [Syzygium oleosum]